MRKQRDYYGLVLGKNGCNLPTEFARTAIDVDLSYHDIRPFGCPVEKCVVEGDYLGYVGDCCHGEYYYVCDPKGVIAIKDGVLSCAEDPCSDHSSLATSTPDALDHPTLVGDSCDCGEYEVAIRYAELNCRNQFGPLSATYVVPKYEPLVFDHEVVVFAYIASHGTGGWFCQGSNTTFSNYHVSDLHPYTEGWCNPEEDMKYLVRHKSGSLMAAKGKTLHISHPVFPHLWDKYQLEFCQDIVSIQEENGEVFVFDGQRVYAITQEAVGFNYNQIEDDVCVNSHKAVTTYAGTLFAATRDGIKSIASNNFRRSSFGYVDESLMNPTWFRDQPNDWKIAAFNSRLHFTNGEKAYLFDLTGDKYALTEISLVPDDYFTDCDGIYYLSGGKVYEWNAGDDCEYHYCTNRWEIEEGCQNIGAIRVEGQDNGGSITSVYYSDHCSTPEEICEHTTCLCETMTIDACNNTRNLSVCFRGTDIICNHELAKAPMELR